MHRTWTAAAIAAFAIGGAGLAADQGGRVQSTGATSAERSNDQSGMREFINTMAIAGMAEVQLGKLAAERAQDPDVKAFGQMMVKDHTEANDELKQAASPGGVQLPTQLDEKHRELADRLMRLQGEEFDREYMKAMVDGHEDVADQLLRQAGWIGTSTRNGSTAAAPSATGTSGTANSGATSSATGTSGTVSNASRADASGSGSADANVKMWAIKTLPVVQQHLQRAREIRDNVEKGR
jgi:putative membrane protein